MRSLTRCLKAAAGSTPTDLLALNFRGAAPPINMRKQRFAREAAAARAKEPAMFIQTEPTPNPATLKFLPGRPVLASGTLDMRDKEVAAQSPLAERLRSEERRVGKEARARWWRRDAKRQPATWKGR